MSVEASVSEELEQALAEPGKKLLVFEQRLVEIITEWKTGARNDPLQLQKVISSVKKGLTDKTASISALMTCDDFVPMLISGLKAKTVQVQLDVMSIVNLVLKDGSGPEAEMIIGSGMILALITLLTSVDDAVCQQALEILRDMALKHVSSLDQFRNSDIIQALIKVAEGTKNTQRLHAIAIIAESIVPPLITNLDEPMWIEGLLPLSSVYELVILFKVLMSKDLTQPIENCVLTGIGGVSRVEGSFGVIVSSGILPSVVDLLSHQSDFDKFGTLAALTTLLRTATSDEERLQFFLALRGSSGLKHFWKSVFYINAIDKTGDESLGYIHVFMNEVEKACVRAITSFTGGVKAELIDALIDTGFVCSLVKCLEKEADLKSQVTAMHILMKIVSGIRKDKLQPILDAGLVPLLLEQLSSSDVRSRTMAPIILKHLFRCRPTVRDEIVRLSGLQQMIRILKDEREEFDPIVHLLMFLLDMLRQKFRNRKLPLELFEGVPEALKMVLANKAKYSAQEPKKLFDIHNFYITSIDRWVFRCVEQLLDYGDSGIDLIMRAGLFEVFVRALSSSQDDEKLRDSLTAVVHFNTQQKYGDELLKLGVLDTFPRLLQNPSDELRKVRRRRHSSSTLIT